MPETIELDTHDLTIQRPDQVKDYQAALPAPPAPARQALPADDAPLSHGENDPSPSSTYLRAIPDVAPAPPLAALAPAAHEALPTELGDATTFCEAPDAAAPDETPPDAPLTPTRKAGQVEGIVVALAPNVFEVVVDGATYLCAIRGRLRKQRQRGAPTPPTPPTSGATGGRRQPFDARRDASGASLGKHDRRDLRARRRTDETAPTDVVVEAHDEISGEAARPTRVAPGDRVLVTPLGPGEGVIEDILPRRTTLARMRSEVGSEQIMMANLSLAVLVFATYEPAPNIGLLDRYLALCEHARVRALICLNKRDLGLSAEAREVITLYEGLGYPVLQVSAVTGEGVAGLRARLAGQTALLTGPSGVGKSSLMNMLIPGAGQRTGEISEATGKGRHTTTGARLLPLPGGGWLADTAGIRELALWQTPPDQLARCFVELRPIADDCEYDDCAHAANEEGCAIQAALAAGRIAPSRFANFMRLLGEARADERPAWE